MTPIWLLDVDGVLNAVVDTPDWSVWNDWRRGQAHADGFPWPICFSPTVMATIARLLADKVVDVRWLTTWRDNANGQLRTLLGLPALPVAGSGVIVQPEPTAAPSGEADPAPVPRGGTVSGPGREGLVEVRRRPAHRRGCTRSATHLD